MEDEEARVPEGQESRDAPEEPDVADDQGRFDERGERKGRRLGNQRYS